MFYTGTFLSTESQHLLIFRVKNVKFFKVFVNFFKAFVNFFKKNVNFFNKQHLSNFLYKTLHIKVMVRLGVDLTKFAEFAIEVFIWVVEMSRMTVETYGVL